MTDDQVREWAREAGLDWHRGFVLDNDENRYAALARLARADAFDLAAKAIRRRNDGRHPIMVSERVEAEKCAKAIEALAAAEKEPRP